MGTISTTLKIDADARGAELGLRGLQTSLEEIKTDAEDAESALGDLDKQHRININDEAIDNAKEELGNLQRQLRDELQMGVDTRETQRKIRAVKSAIKLIGLETPEVDVDVDIDKTSLAAMTPIMSAFGSVWGAAAGSTAGISFVASMAAAVGAAALTGAAVGIGAIGVAAGFGAGEALKLADAMANAKIAFTQFLGNEKRATKFLENLRSFAAETPFEFPELVDSAKQLLAFGFDAEDIIPTVEAIGDAAALVGADVGDLTTIWGQMKAKGKVSNEELLQLTEAGIPAYQMLADELGVTVGEVQEMAEKGKLLSDDIMPKLQSRMEDTFGGGMAKQAETLGGKFSTLKDTLGTFGTELGEAMTPIADALIEKLQPALEDLSDWASTHKGEIALALTTGFAVTLDVLAVVTDAVSGLVDAFGWAVDFIGEIVVQIGEALQVFGDLPGVPDDFGDGVVAAGEDIKDFGNTAHETADSMRGLADDMRTGADDARQYGQDLADSVRADDIKAKIGIVKGELEDLRKKPPTPQVQIDIQEAKDKLRDLRDELEDVTYDERIVKFNADMEDLITKKDDIETALKNLRDKPQTVKVQGQIDHWKEQLRIVNGDIQELTQKKPHVAIDVDDDGTIDLTEEEIQRLVNKDWEAVINFRLGEAPSGGFQLPGTEPRSLMAPSAPLGPGLLAAGALLTAPGPTPWFSPTAGLYGGTGGVGGQPGGTGGSRTTLAPRSTPVKVYLDGEEISDKLVTRVASRFTPAGRGRRTA